MRIRWIVSPTPSSGQTVQYVAGASAWTKELQPLIDDHRGTHWWISSVHRGATQVLETFLGDQTNCNYEIVRYSTIDLHVDVDFPERVGVDRLLAAYAAGHYADDRPLLVIQAGSAVTVDLLENSDDGMRSRFSGGAILPGVPMMLQLLGKSGDMLPELEPQELVDLPPLPGRNSQAAMMAGVASSLVGGLQHVVERYRQKFGSQVRIVLSGGDGPLLRPHLTGRILVVDHLVLQGLRILVQSKAS